MDSRSIGTDLSLAWPTNEIAVMGAEGAVKTIFRREIAAAQNQEAKTQELIDMYTERFANPFIAAQRGYVDDIVEAHLTRRVIAKSLEMLANKRVERPKRKHGNIPL
jgi:propionyl-CoA carboxylase beta chain